MGHEHTLVRGLDERLDLEVVAVEEHWTGVLRREEIHLPTGGELVVQAHRVIEHQVVLEASPSRLVVPDVALQILHDRPPVPPSPVA